MQSECIGHVYIGWDGSIVCDFDLALLRSMLVSIQFLLIAHHVPWAMRCGAVSFACIVWPNTSGRAGHTVCWKSLAHTSSSYEYYSLDGSSPLRLCFIYAARYSWSILFCATGFCHHTVYDMQSEGISGMKGIYTYRIFPLMQCGGFK